MQANNCKLVANFPSYGLYLYDGTTWTLLTPNDSVQDLIEVASNLYADYGRLGFWKFDGSSLSLIGFLVIDMHNHLRIGVRMLISSHF